MYSVENQIFYMTKGDDAVFAVEKITAGDSVYELQDGDRLTLTVRKAPDKTNPVLLQLHSVNGRFPITPKDTANMEVGKYSADVQLDTADNKRITIYPILTGNDRSRIKAWNNFIIMPEVTTNE